MHGHANIVDAENSPLAPYLQGEKKHHWDKMWFLSYKYFNHDVNAGKERYTKRNFLLRLVRG